MKKTKRQTRNHTGKLPKDPSKRGRPESAPTWHQERTLLDVIEVTGSDTVACVKARVPRSSFALWLQKGRQDREAGLETYWTEFLGRIEGARVDRTFKLEQLIRDDALKERRAESAKWKLERIDPKRYGQRIRVQVEEELNDALERLQREFGDEPETLERILSAIAGTSGPAPSESAPGPEDGADDSGSQAVSAPLPKPEAIALPESDV